ncbi:MBL fold metallo-hydrolase [Duganella sp. LX20W]|uniref:MBL fold metallo-hydrolase n=1 Tax=Rugamonas brunnea TaxID=2758569 RepID=A0A7W2ES53_9BURK|nr:alkyl sulfatase dimerization domain-containing protein [Rugamonas brunnea]MBA5637642.1 MBL fold metallo-hydrolase [Rugamonas brunnea]
MARIARLTALALAVCTLQASATTPSQPASPITAAANQAFGAGLPLADRQDFDDAARGLVAVMPDGPYKDANGNVVWQPHEFDFIHGAAPASVNPSLWRQETLNNKHGLYKVSDGIYQLRGFDISNMTLIEGKTGWIVVDPLVSAEMARAGLEFAQQQLGRRPVAAVIYTHGHADHFGGVRGVISEADLAIGKARLIAPDGFMETAVAENVLAGNAMARRAHYHFGMPLDAGPLGNVGTGLGKKVSTGTIGLIAPTDTVARTGQTMDIDGVRFVFQLANGSEAPAEMTFYLPERHALCLAEVVTTNMHNIYTPRGARMRDALGWSKYINEMLDLFPDAEVGFRSHHWPVWGKDRLRQQLANHRDMYRFLNDQALNLANRGVPFDEIGDAGFFPKGLKTDFSTHGYYGTLSHNLRAVVDYYLGWYDGNPATLNPLTGKARAQHYVAAMGGAKAVLKQARAGYAAGDYRWVAEMLNHLVKADPANQAARQLQADTLEQLGYQSESAIWRNEYLTGARELRDGLKALHVSTQGPDLTRAMSVEMIFDFLAVRLNHEKADGLRLGVNIAFTDTHENYALELSNSVLNNTRGRVLAQPDAALTLSRDALFKMLLAKVPLAQLVQAGEVKLEGDPKALAALFGNFDQFDPLFPIVTR